MGRFLFILFLFVPFITYSQDQQQLQDSLSKELLSEYFSYGPKGFSFTTPDKQFSLQLQSRFQFRYAYPNDENPITFDDFRTETEHLFKINRARFKVGGHGYKPWLKYYWEYELSAGVLLDYRIMVEKWDEFNIKVGQWKIDYTRERTISSGSQQMVDRSILNRTFTVDRQQGIAFYGRLFKETPADINYWLTVATGTGRGNRMNEDEYLMYVAKIQWNVFGRPVEMTGSDLQNRNLPDLSIGFAALTNRSSFTRFSTSGGGSLPGYEDTMEPGDYRLNQLLFESALKYKGFSWQHETHRKNIIDKTNGTESALTGSFFQGGYFFHNLFSWVPENLEIAARFSTQTVPNETRRLIEEEEYAFAINYFFAGHRNKLTLEYAWFVYEDDALNMDVSDERIRLQWDISI
jgi:phosphate-selective porin OprO and OprP